MNTPGHVAAVLAEAEAGGVHGAGLAAPLAHAGARVVWRCHIGVDWEDEVTRAGWEFLRPYLAAAEARSGRPDGVRVGSLPPAR